MRAWRMILGMAIAVAIVGSAAIATASASPAWYECAKSAGGKYSDSTCTTEGSGKLGKYEIEPGIGKGKIAKNR